MVRIKCKICGQLTPIDMSSEDLVKEVFPKCPSCGSKWGADPDKTLKKIMEKLEKEAKK